MNANERPVTGPDGLYGTVDTTCWPSPDGKMQTNIHVRRPDGSHVTVPADALIEQKDGSYYLPMKQDQVNATAPDGDALIAAADPKTWPCGKC